MGRKNISKKCRYSEERVRDGVEMMKSDGGGTKGEIMWVLITRKG